jgi:hypothetical protein
MVEVGRLDQVDALFTDAAPPPAFQALLAEAGVGCTIGGDAGHTVTTTAPGSNAAAPGDRP